eukprot:TRINITY_DN8714_c0_g1_i2.p1 TRINITY_DN8714_c0_g1~~TRINITY_DN8714_c0_g1_i2.p1  ORF type:complete len:198 (-),score=15.59 TRINITY_DN8714_c0_g1_i2:495-1088(-)
MGINQSQDRRDVHGPPLHGNETPVTSVLSSNLANNMNNGPRTTSIPTPTSTRHSTQRNPTTHSSPVMMIVSPPNDPSGPTPMGVSNPNAVQQTTITQPLSSSPPGTYSQEIPSMEADPAKPLEPPALPPHLQRALLNTAPLDKDPTLLPLPPHVMLNHVYSLPKNEDVVIFGITQRYTAPGLDQQEKFVTTVFYKPT